MWHQLANPASLHIPKNIDCLFSNKAEGVSNSAICPLSNTKTLLESMMVFNLCAMVITVHSLNSFLIVFCMRSSVSKSTAAVASSRIKIFVFLSKARARQMSWRWPIDRLTPPSETWWNRPAGSAIKRTYYQIYNMPVLFKDLPEIKSFKWANSTVFQTSSSEYTSNGSKFNLKVPENNTASWGMIVNFDLKSWRPISAIFTPSMMIFPALASIILQKNSYKPE